MPATPPEKPAPSGTQALTIWTATGWTSAPFASGHPVSGSETEARGIRAIISSTPGWGTTIVAYEGIRSYRPVIMGRRGAVASNHPLATQAGLLALQAGGDAVDAA